MIPSIVSQHLEDAASQRVVRSVLTRAPHVRLLHLARWDERLAANLDGLSIAGEGGVRMIQASLASPGIGALFVATVSALAHRDLGRIEQLLALTPVVPEAWRALASAFGWVSAADLRGITAPLMASSSPAQRGLGIAACALHRVDPGAALATAIDQPHAGLRARALQGAGELGRRDLLDRCLAHLTDDDDAGRFAAARAAVLLGDAHRGPQALEQLAWAPGPRQHAALALALRRADPDSSRALVRQLTAQGAPLRTLIRAAGWAGDAHVVPWLIKHMADDDHARLAGESFSLITGLDLAGLDLERKPPDRGGPNDDPHDDNVAMDEDDSLPWPDVDKIGAWWRANSHRYAPGTRFFMGEPPALAHCMTVLNTGFQRQRIAAADYLTLMQPGTPLFNVAAPAWRQQRLLASLRAS